MVLPIIRRRTNYGIDFERVVSAAEDKTETATPTTPAEPVKNNEPEIAGIDPNKDPFA